MYVISEYSKSLFLCCCFLLLLSYTDARPTHSSRHTRTSPIAFKMANRDQTDYIRILEECSNDTSRRREMDLARIKKMLESAINTSTLALQEANVSGNEFVSNLHFLHDCFLFFVFRKIKKICLC